jgi:predicted CoA-binding protein
MIRFRIITIPDLVLFGQKIKNIIMSVEMNALEILNTRKVFAVIGVSNDDSKYGFEVYNILKEHNYKVYPVNPKYNDISGNRCYPSVNSIPEAPEVIIIVLSPSNTAKIIDSFLEFKNSVFWLPPGCWSEEANGKLRKNGMNFIYDVCPVGRLKGF